MHILVATDGSDLALDAATRGLALLASPTKVTMLSVMKDVLLDTGAGGIEGPVYTPEQEDEVFRGEQEAARRALASTRAVVQAASTSVVIDERIEVGDAAPIICAIALDLHVDVIVLGSHGKGFIARVVLGSVSEHVTRHAPCPVMVVRAKEAPKH